MFTSEYKNGGHGAEGVPESCRSRGASPSSNAGRAFKTSLIYFIAAVFCLVFGAVYEAFSFGVMSFRMVYAFCLPLIPGAVPFMLIALLSPDTYPGRVCRNLYHAGIATLTAGCITGGALEIYGTTNGLIKIYTIAGLLLTVLSGAVFAYEMLRKQEKAGEIKENQGKDACYAQKTRE